MTSARALRPIGRGNGTRPRGNSGAVSSSDPGRSVYFVYRAHRDLLKGSTARELGWRLAPHKTIEARERAREFWRVTVSRWDTCANQKLASPRRQIVFQRHRPFSDIPKDANQSSLGPRMDMGRPS